MGNGSSTPDPVPGRQSISYNTTFTDIYSCYVLYRRELMYFLLRAASTGSARSSLEPAELRSTGWEQRFAEIPRAVATRGVHLFEVPVSYNGRTYDEGKKIRAHHIQIAPCQCSPRSSAAGFRGRDRSKYRPTGAPRPNHRTADAGREGVVDDKLFGFAVLIPLEAPFVDARGTIQPLVDCAVQGALLITSKPSVRRFHGMPGDRPRRAGLDLGAYCAFQVGGVSPVNRTGLDATGFALSHSNDRLLANPTAARMELFVSVPSPCHQYRSRQPRPRRPSVASPTADTATLSKAASSTTTGWLMKPKCRTGGAGNKVRSTARRNRAALMMQFNLPMARSC